MMEYNKLIAEMSLSDEVEGFYVLKAAYPKTTATGKPFLSASLSDRSGSIEIKVWDYSGPISSADEGNVVKICALSPSSEAPRRLLSIGSVWLTTMILTTCPPWSRWLPLMWTLRWQK